MFRDKDPRSVYAGDASIQIDVNNPSVTPEDYLHRDIVFHDVLVGDLFHMHIETFGGDTFFLRIEDKIRNSIGGFADVFVPILPRSLALQWSSLGFRAFDFQRSNTYGRFRPVGSYIIFKIRKIEILGHGDTVIEVIE